MDGSGRSWHFSAMNARDPDPIPAWHLYGERTPFPDILHLERIVDRAAGLDWRINPHRHAHLAQVFLLECGHFAFTVDGHTTHPRAPTLLFLPPDTVHGFTFSAGTEGWVLTLPAPAHPELFGEGAELASLTGTHFSAKAPDATAALFEGLAAEWRGQGALRRTRLRAGVMRLFCEIFETEARHRRPAATDPRLTTFLDLIARHHARHWSMARYGTEVGMSVRNLARVCRECTGQSPQQLVETHLMREACRLLAYTRMPAQQVAFQLGFHDPSYFNRRFRRAMGVSPGTYRRRLEDAPAAR
ncbi:MAG: helix-turn-helix domain-containing protein [Paracoccus sp.]|nr:helix-turn-helix domain-containing protein [Paracoccus sp. (in: a-proteobacteria)]